MAANGAWSAAPFPAGLRLWLAPLTAAAMLLLTFATAWSPGGNPATGAVALARLPSTRDIAIAHIERNVLPRPSFGSTAAGAMTSSFGSLLLRQTNILAR